MIPRLREGYEGSGQACEGMPRIARKGELQWLFRLHVGATGRRLSAIGRRFH